ncbi:MAG: tRNA (adenosine(37)-N6)-dimethylallyltransferase MiaA [Methylococcaceae bacterium]|nr:tRNA (adenosine(37)-N6)-dimethylallyltransferase MiaA [Methylococcaceae bacterium]
MSRRDLPSAIFIMGPTASGKTKLAVQLAKQLDTEIISVDSVLVYKGMDIGTAKPSLEERQGIPHHLIDILDPSEVFSTGSFRKIALQLMEDISRRGKIPVLVGGTMLYFNSLFNGLASLPEANLEIRKKLDDELLAIGKEAMHARLKSIDPESALRIHPNDPQRVQRALEVYELSGKPMTRFFYEAQQQQIPYKKIKLIIAPEDRLQLHEKIAQRFRLMIEQGLIDEVSTLYQRGDLSESLPAIRAVGYRQAWSYLQGEYDLDTVIEKAIIATRQLAKRQFTWLRREDDILRFQSYEADLYDKVVKSIENCL